MAQFKVTVKDTEVGNRLKVTFRDKVLFDNCDYGEPEDNSFRKDYAWVKPALEKAYNLGLQEGARKASKGLHKRG
jgi:hypothetical protein